MPLAIKLTSAVPEPTRTIALMAILGIVLLGLLLIAIAMLGASWARKQGKYRRGPAVPPDVFVRPDRSQRHSGKQSAMDDDEPLSSRDTVVEDEPAGSDDTMTS